MTEEITESFLYDRIHNSSVLDFALELHAQFNCWFSFDFESSGDVHDQRLNFFKKNNFLICHNMFDKDWSNEIQAEEIFKKLILLYELKPNDENVIIVRGPNTIYFPGHRFIKLMEGSVFAYDETKIEVEYEKNPS